MKKALIISSVILLASCSLKVIKPTQADLSRGQKEFPGMTMAQLEEGKSTFKRLCTQCHPAKSPTSRGEKEWREVVPEMAGKAAHKPKKKQISEADQQLILKYLITMSGRK